MKEVDQETGEDLNPQNTKRLIASAQGESSDFGGGGNSFLPSMNSMNVARNPDRPLGSFSSAADDDLFGGGSKVK